MSNFSLIDVSSTPTVDHLLHMSVENPENLYALFKHSTRCPISSMALNRMEKCSIFIENKVPFYYLDLLKNRATSNYIAEKLQVEHQSPQLIIIKNGKTIAHTSHNDITENWIKEFV